MRNDCEWEIGMIHSWVLDLCSGVEVIMSLRWEIYMLLCCTWYLMNCTEPCPHIVPQPEQLLF